jgi:hypothetical protein
MSLHSPEPWHDGYDREVSTVGLFGSWYIYSGQRPIALCRDEAERQRIVACVNALAGIAANDLPKVRALWFGSVFDLTTGLWTFKPTQVEEHGEMPPREVP